MYLNQIKDIYKMNVLNPSRFKDECFSFFRANNQGYIDFGNYALGEVQNLQFEFDMRIPSAIPDYDEIIAWNVNVPNAGIYVGLNPGQELAINIYKGTGIAKAVTSSLSSYYGDIIHVVVNYYSDEVSISTNVLPKVFGVYENLQYSGARITTIGKLGAFNRIADKVEVWNVVVREMTPSGTIINTLADWSLNGDALDQSGNGIDGTLVDWSSYNWGNSCE